MLEVRNLVKKFDDVVALDDLNLTVDNSSVYGLVGYNGAGKTTLLKIIADAYLPTSGTVKIDGENVRNNARLKSDMFYVPDDLFFLPFSTMEKMMRFYRGFYPDFSIEVFKNLSEMFELDTKKRIAGFSKGMQRQAEIVFALSSMPKLLLMDESFDGIDPQKRSVIKNILLEYMAEKEATVIISSHNLHELSDMCDHVGLMNGQTLAIDCSVDEIDGSRCKYRLVFADNKTEKDFGHIPYKSFKSDGMIVTLTLNGDLQESEAALRAMSPLAMEKTPLSLEEIFIEEMEGKKYDYSKIFK